MTISDIEEREIIKGFKVRFVHTEKSTIAFWNVEKGAEFQNILIFMNKPHKLLKVNLK